MQESILLYFQEMGSPVLDFIFELITMLGEKNILIGLIAWIFWNINKKKGFILSFTLLFSLVVNTVLKISFHRQRPFEVIPEIAGKRVHTATGYSFPSGHTQGATTFYLTLALLFKKRWFYVVAVLISLLVAVSRLYLGVHWPVDVIGSLIAGSLISIFIYLVLNKIYDNARLREWLLIFSTMIVFVVLIYFDVINRIYFSGSLVLTDLVKTIGVFSGASLGFIIEERFISFSVNGSLVKKIIRFVIGLAFSLAFLSGLKLVLPSADISHFIRYGIVGLWITCLYPLIGIKTGLFTS
ncbi:MAG: phosphatase PAP2 family protein [Spirochaetales bacterium]|nr:phosphatase PAP2 family protein [Spirochaetales bacterium]